MSTKESADGSKVVLTKQDYFEDKTLPLQIYMRDPQTEFPLHSHSFEELVVVFSGTAMHVVNGQGFPVKEGDVFVIPPRQIHRYEDMHQLVLANILMDVRALEMKNWDIRALPGFHALFALEPAFRIRHQFRSRLQLDEQQLRKVREWVYDIEHESESKSPGYRVMAIGVFMQLAVYLSRCYSDEPTEESLDLLRIGDAIAHIESNYGNRISLDELADKTHLSKRQFQRVFKECMGRTPMEHLCRVRVEKAAEMLRQGNGNITEIAFKCGFSDSNYFTRCFRQIMNQTPRQYRKT